MATASGEKPEAVSSAYLLSKIEQARASVKTVLPAASNPFRPPRRLKPKRAPATPPVGPPLAYRAALCRPKSVREAAKCVKLQGCPYQGGSSGRSFDVSGVLHRFKIKRPASIYGVHDHSLTALAEVGLEWADRRDRQRKLVGRREQHAQAAWEEAEKSTGRAASQVWVVPSTLPLYGMSLELWGCLLPGWAQRSTKGTRCEHYSKGCAVRAACCGGIFSCRKCHDALTGHVMSHAASVLCTLCGAEGPVGARCSSAKCQGRRFARYFCSICEVWEDRSDVHLYHCHQCGTCKPGMGFGIDSWHCDQCGECFPLSSWDSHKCGQIPALACGGCLDLTEWSPHICKTEHMHDHGWHIETELPPGRRQRTLKPTVEASVMLQKVARGWLHRKRFKLWRSCATSATTITAVLRSTRSSRLWRQWSTAQAASIAIQKVARARAARIRTSNMRRARAEREELQMREQNERETAAAQSVVRGGKFGGGGSLLAGRKMRRRSLADKVKGMKLWGKVRKAHKNDEIKDQGKAEAFETIEVEFMGVKRSIKIKPPNLKKLKQDIKKRNQAKAEESKQRSYPAVGAMVPVQSVEKIDSLVDFNPDFEPIQAYHYHKDGATWKALKTGHGSKCGSTFFMNEQQQPGTAYRKEKEAQSKPGWWPASPERTLRELRAGRVQKQKQVDAEIFLKQREKEKEQKQKERKEQALEVEQCVDGKTVMKLGVLTQQQADVRTKEKDVISALKARQNDNRWVWWRRVDTFDRAIMNEISDACTRIKDDIV